MVKWNEKLEQEARQEVEQYTTLSKSEKYRYIRNLGREMSERTQENCELLDKIALAKRKQNRPDRKDNDVSSVVAETVLVGAGLFAGFCAGAGLSTVLGADPTTSAIVGIGTATVGGAVASEGIYKAFKQRTISKYLNKKKEKKLKQKVSENDIELAKSWRVRSYIEEIKQTEFEMDRD